MLYDWIKAFHVIAIIAWMAGMLYLPRLFVYHSDVPKGSIQSETFKLMERRLLKAIINPAMGLAWILGLILMRYVLEVEPVASMPPDEVVAIYGPTLQRYLTGALPPV